MISERLMRRLAAPRGTCRVCDRKIQVDPSGRVRRHKALLYNSIRDPIKQWKWCPGSRHPSKEEVE